MKLLLNQQHIFSNIEKNLSSLNKQPN